MITILFHFHILEYMLNLLLHFYPLLFLYYLILFLLLYFLLILFVLFAELGESGTIKVTSSESYGEVKITITCAGKTATCTVKIQAP